jgi:hypothetical protein
MARVDLPGGSIRARRQRRRVIAFSAAGGALILFVAGMVALSHASFLRIESVSIVGAKTTSPEKIKTLAQEQLEGAYAYLFARDNIFIYSKKDIQTSILEENPIIKNVEVEAVDFHTIEITLVERSPKALWCKGECYFLDEDGVVYADAPAFSSPVYVSYKGKAQDGGLPKQFLTIDSFHSLSALIDALSQTQPTNPITEVSVDSYGDVHARFQNDFVLIFALSDESGDVFERFTLALTAEPFKNHSLSDFEYLDLRFGDKLYFKQKGALQ